MSYTTIHDIKIHGISHISHSHISNYPDISCKHLCYHRFSKYIGPPPKKDTLGIDQIQRRAVRVVKNDYRIYIKEEQQYNSATEMINDLACKDLEDRSRDTHLTLFYKIVDREVNAPSEGIIILIKKRTRKSNVHNKFI